MKLTGKGEFQISRYLLVKACLVFSCACVFLLGSCAENSEVYRPRAAVSTQQQAANSPEGEPSVCELFREDLRDWPDRLWTEGKATFSQPDNITALLLAGAASVYMHQRDDQKIADYFAAHGVFHDWPDETLNIIGQPTVQIAAGDAWFVLSASRGDTLSRERAWTMRTALTISWLSTWGLKLARDNGTPNGNDWAWPSGHTASSFTAASVLDEFYGHKVGIPAYGLASLVAFRMMDAGDDWASDVVFGATLGWVVGHSVASRDKDLTVGGFQVVPLVPMTEEPAMGIGLVKRF